MKRFVVTFLKFVVVTILITAIISSIAIKSISELAAENHELRQQITRLENSAKEPQMMDCTLHVELLPGWNIEFLTYQIPMEFPTTWDYCQEHSRGDLLPILQFEECFFLALYVTVK